MSEIAVQALDAGRCPSAMQDLDVFWLSSRTGPSSGKMQLQLHQTLALANANVALEMLRGFSPPLLKRAYVLTTNKQVCKESIFKMITGYQ